MPARGFDDRMSAEQSNAPSISVHEAILESLHDAIVIIDPTGDVELCNGAAEEMFGRKRADLCGRPLDELLVGNSLTGQNRGYYVQQIYERSRVGTRLDMLPSRRTARSGPWRSRSPTSPARANGSA